MGIKCCGHSTRIAFRALKDSCVAPGVAVSLLWYPYPAAATEWLLAENVTLKLGSLGLQLFKA